MRRDRRHAVRFMSSAAALRGSFGCVEPSVKSRMQSATIHRVDTRRLDLNLLVTLEARLVEQNVTKAAARLHLSQPAVSAQLRRLRDVFDDPLLIPAQRGMTPTAKAIELLDPLRQALDQVRATVATHRNFDPARARLTVTIACTDYLQSAVVKPLISSIRKETVAGAVEGWTLTCVEFAPSPLALRAETT